MTGAGSAEIAIWADMSPRIGMGHVMRCRTLGIALRERGSKVHVIASGLTESLIEDLHSHGITCHEGAPSAAAADGPAWPEQAVTEIVRRRPRGVVIDRYGLPVSVFTRLTEAGVRYAILDDRANSFAPAPRLVVDQNPGAAPADYARLASSTVLLLGTEYALIRPEVRAVVPSPQRDPNAICLSLGGADPGGLTGPLACALAASGWSCYVVIGSANAQSATVRTLLRGAARITLVEPVDLPGLLGRVRVAIVGAGITMWEAAYLSTPYLAVCTSPVHLSVALAGAAAGLGGAVLVDPQAPAEGIAEVLRQLSVGPVPEGTVSSVIDGKGAERVADQILEVFS